MLESLFNKVAGLYFYSKGTLTQVFSYEIYEIFKNTYFEENLRMTAYGIYNNTPSLTEIHASF